MATNLNISGTLTVGGGVKLSNASGEKVLTTDSDKNIVESAVNIGNLECLKNVITTNVSNYMGFINTSFDTERLFSDYIGPGGTSSNITLYDIFARLPVKCMFIEHIGDNMPQFVQEIREYITNGYGDFVMLKLNESSAVIIAFIRYNDTLPTQGSDIYWRYYVNSDDRGWDAYWHRVDRIDIDKK